MSADTNHTFLGILAFLGLAGGMLVFMEIGRRVNKRLLSLDPKAARSGLGVVEGAVFSLIALLIAFTFYGTATRLDERRQLVVEEANAIGTAWLRLDLLPAAAQPSLREKFRQYVATRIAFDQQLPNITAANAGLSKSAALQAEIWTEAMADCRETGSPTATMLLVPALNDMFDLNTTRTMAVRIHTPLLIYGVLLVLVLAGSLLVGYGMAGGKMHNWFHSFAFIVTITLAMYLILDFEFPSVGLIRLGPFDQVLLNLQQNMNP
jgi:hypothetical protein